jgi:ferredoxin--NADP+ reductase
VDEKSRTAASNNPALKRRLDILHHYAVPDPVTKSRRITLRFLTSPMELIGNQKGRVEGVRIVRNELSHNGQGRIRPRQTEKFELLEAGLVLRSVGYKGIPLYGLPFLEDRGIVPNDHGRVIDPSTGNTIRGVYVSGWIKRGAHGVIGTNKGDAKETVSNLMVDLQNSAVFNPKHPGPGSIDTLLKDRNIRYVSYEEWQTLDRLETALGRPSRRPRVKFTSRKEIFEALDAPTPPLD